MSPDVSSEIEPTRAMLRFEHLAVEAELPREVAVAAAPSERAPGARQQFPEAHGKSSAPPRRRAMIAAMRCQSSASRCNCLRPARVRL